MVLERVIGFVLGTTLSINSRYLIIVGINNSSSSLTILPYKSKSFWSDVLSKVLSNLKPILIALPDDASSGIYDFVLTLIFLFKSFEINLILFFLL